MLAGAVAELATIGALIPFLTLLADVGSSKHRWLRWLSAGHGGPTALLISAALFVLLAIAAALVRLQLARSSRNFIYGLGHEITLEIQRRVLLQPFSFHIHRNTSTLLTALNKVETLVSDILLPLMLAVSGAVIALAIVAFFLAIDPLATVCVTAALAGTYLLISRVVRRRLLANSDLIKTAYDERMQIVQESLSGIRDVIIDRSQSMYLGRFRDIDLELAGARSQTQFLALAPRYIIEMVGMVIIAAVALGMAMRPGGIAAELPALGALALGAQRLLPLVQDAYRGWLSAHGERSIFDQVVELLSLPVPAVPAEQMTAFPLRSAVKLDHVSFKYPTRGRVALDDVSLTVPSGKMIALIGATGSGKSTLVDVLMGLLQPDSGRALIDEVPLTPASQQQWYRSVGHVPQSIFLADASISHNIALSLPDVPPDKERIVAAAKQAQLHDFITSLPAGYETYVGERGVRLSGGQRQRLGIARAVYKAAPLLVLDEATSALDEATEDEVLKALTQLRSEGRTIIMVAHRHSTIRHCDLVVRLDKGRVVESGSFDQLFGRKRSA